MGTSKFLLILFLVCKNYAFPSSNPFGVTLREEHTRNFAKNVLEPRVTIERSASLVGEVKLYSGDASFLPTSWIFCHGQALSRTEYRHLFSVIGESFGNGDGKETFNVPDLRGRFVMGRDTSKVRTDNAANMGNTGGHATHTLMEKQLPAHSHGVGSLTVDNSGLHTHTIHDPGHTHNFNYGHWDLINGQKRVEVPINHNAHWGPLENTIQKSYTGISVFSAGNHIHALTGRTDSTGNTQSFSVLNPYQILDYIIFTGDNDHPNMNNDVTNHGCPDFVVKQNWDYRGSHVDRKTNQTAYTDCCAHCSRDDKCNAFTWNRKTQTCYLKGSIDHVGQSDMDSVAGYRLDTASRTLILKSGKKFNVSSLKRGIKLMAEWFPEHAKLIKMHEDEILELILNDEEPSDDSPLRKIIFKDADVFMESNSLISFTPCEETCGDVAVDVVFFALSLVSLKVKNDERINRALMEELGSDTLRGFSAAINNFGNADGALNKAQALWDITGGVYKAGGFKLVLKSICSQLTWKDWVKAVVTSAEQFTIWFDSNGAAFFAEVLLSIESTEQLVEDTVTAKRQCF